MKPDELPRFGLSAGILAVFAYAFIRNPHDDLLVGALIAMATTAVSYWLGSSKGSSDKADQIGDMHKAATGKENDPVHTVEES